MSIRMIARELYRLQREVEELEKNIKTLPQGDKEEMTAQLRKLRAERDRMRGILNGSKDDSPYRKPR